jgi:hypothetical protein
LLAAAEGRRDVEVRRRDPWAAADRDRLMAGADCYLSLHRADGGLGSVAKAMSWGTFVVVTSTPASEEFQTERDSGLVRSETVPIPADEYRYPAGSVWADPDLEHASSLLRWVVAEPRAVAAKVLRARQVASRRFARSVGVAAVRSRLADIDARLQAGRSSNRLRVEPARRHVAARR